MEYTISALAKLSGVSSRTLRYYDQIKLLQPQRTNSAGYIYERQEVDRLQQILYFKSFGLSLETIRGILDEPQESIKWSCCNITNSFYKSEQPWTVF